MPLTTRSLYKEAYGTSADSDLLDAIIPQASAAIERHLDRTLELTTYRRWFDGTGCNRMLLTEWPITRVYGISLDYDTALRVKHTSASMATVMVDSTAVRLFSVNATTGAETDSELLFTAYPTVTLMAAAITALGWSCTTESGYSTLPSSTFRTNAAQYAVSPSEADIEIADESETINVAVETDRMIRRISGTTMSTQNWDNTELIFPAGIGNVFVWWKAGYTFPVDNAAHTGRDTAGNVPLPLTMVCNAIARAMFLNVGVDTGGMQSANMTDFSYTLAENGRAIADQVLKEYANTLNKYRRFL